jgi:predicted nuclease with TOPRIM domain
MTESELIKRITDMRDENTRYESEANLEEIIERLDAERAELKETKADLEDDNRHLAERVKLLEHKRNELLDELKRVGDGRERDFMAGQLIAYRQVLRMILNRGKE